MTDCGYLILSRSEKGIFRRSLTADFRHSTRYESFSVEIRDSFDIETVVGRNQGAGPIKIDRNFRSHYFGSHPDGVPGSDGVLKNVSSIRAVIPTLLPPSQRLLPPPKRLVAGLHVGGDFGKTHRTEVVGVDADVHYQELRVGGILLLQSPVDMPVEMP